MAKTGNLKFAIFVITVIAISAAIALIVEITKKKCGVKPKINKGTDGNVFPYDSIRLPRHIIPLTYDLYLNPRIEEHTFDGKVDILLQVNFPRNYIVLHNKKLKISNIKLTDIGKAKTYLPIRFLEHKTREQIYVEFSEQLHLFTDYSLHMEFKGDIDTSLAGFYRSNYFDPLSNTTKTLGVTQFEATDARKAFPCFDEPAMKAVYNVKITRKASYKTWFNTPLSVSHTLDNGLVEDTFQTTVKMSTYLVAWVIGDDMLSIHDVTQQGVDISVVTPRHMIGDAKYALSLTKSIVNYFVTLFGVPFPLPKLDLVAIPDFSAGAMENWGLITYRLTKILINDKSSSALDRQNVAMLISHELAHQWFGNIVTMKWWTDLWLNEGFASYVEYLGVEHTHGSWSMNKQFVAMDLSFAMAKDCYYSSHPILIEVSNPQDIGGLFDGITYYKGASVIRMAKFMLTEEKLKISLHNYMKRYQFDSTVTSQLWDEFNKVVPDIDVRAVMDTWTKQMGYPVLTISRLGRTLTIGQQRFLIYAAGRDQKRYTSPYGYVWKIPFTVYQANSREQKNNITILSEKTNEVTLRSDSGWYKANTDFFGFYRVNYDLDNWEKLIAQLHQDHLAFSETDRAQLIDDSFNFARAGILKMSVAFDLTMYLKEERSYVVWKVVNTNLGYITSRMDPDTKIMYKKYMNSKLEDVINEVGWNTQPEHIVSLLQSMVLTMGVELGHKKTVANAAKMFEEFAKNPVEGKYFSSDIKDIVYTAGIAVGGKKAWNFLWNLYLQPNTHSGERLRIILILSTSTDKEIIRKYLDMAFDKSIVPMANFIYIIRAIGANSVGAPVSWDFLVKNYDQILKRYSNTLFAMTDIMMSTSSHFSTIEKYNEVKSFFEKNSAGSGKIVVDEILEKISMNIAYLANNGENVKKWLQSHI